MLPATRGAAVVAVLLRRHQIQPESFPFWQQRSSAASLRDSAATHVRDLIPRQGLLTLEGFCLAGMTPVSNCLSLAYALAYTVA